MGVLKYIPKRGDKYNDWEVIDDVIHRKGTNRASYWMVRCKCGREGIRNASHLVGGTSKRCKSCTATTVYKGLFSNSFVNKIKYRAKQIGIDYNLTYPYLHDLFLSQDKRCKLSGEELTFTNGWATNDPQTASLDRIDSSKGYIKGNVQWVHKDVNFMKGVLTTYRFKELCTKIHENGKL